MTAKMINYDKKNDMLYVQLGDNNDSYGSDEEIGYVIMRDVDSDNITGILIFNLANRIKENSINNFLSQYNIDYNTEILPFI